MKFNIQKQEPEASPEQSSISSQAEPDHFDELLGEIDEKEQQQEIEKARAIMLRKEDFQKLFKGVFKVAAKVSGFQSFRLPNDYVDEADANGCSDAFYDTILEIPAMHFLLYPGSERLQRIVEIGSFTFGMVSAVRAEALQKAQEKVAQEAGADPVDPAAAQEFKKRSTNATEVKL